MFCGEGCQKKAHRCAVSRGLASQRGEERRGAQCRKVGGRDVEKRGGVCMEKDPCSRRQKKGKMIESK